MKTIRLYLLRYMVIELDLMYESTDKGFGEEYTLPVQKVTDELTYTPQLSHTNHALLLKRALKAIATYYPEYLEALQEPLQNLIKMHKAAPGLITSQESELSFLNDLIHAHHGVMKAISTLPTEADMGRCEESEAMGTIIDLGGEVAEACRVVDPDCLTTRETTRWLPPRPHSFDL